MEKCELDLILENHKKWLEGNGGERANLSKLDLLGTSLEGANLQGANLEEVYLLYANLSGANLQEADLRSCIHKRLSKVWK